jgi:RNA polymerase sigma-70 factor (ECF subfamily)
VTAANSGTSIGSDAPGPRPVDPETAEWLESLRGPRSEEALGRLHTLLLRVARSELRRRNSGSQVTGPEVDDLAYQAAADAAMLVVRRIDDFRGESRFTTWACKFVIFEVSNKLGRHFWVRHRPSTDVPDWDGLPARFGVAPTEAAELRDLVAAVRNAVERCLTEKQRDAFIALLVEGVPLDALVVRMGTNRNAVYKLMFDARQKLRTELLAGGYISEAASR